MRPWRVTKRSGYWSVLYKGKLVRSCFTLDAAMRWLAEFGEYYRALLL